MLSNGIKRRRVAYLFAAGLLLSIAAYIAFYLLSMIPSPPVPASIATPGYSRMMAAYWSWYHDYWAFVEACGFCFAAALLLALGVVASLAPRKVQVASFLMLNFFFAWTSHVFSDISGPVAKALTTMITIQDRFIWSNLNLNWVTGYTQVVADMEAFVFFVLLLSLTFALNLKDGRRKALLLAAQIGALSLVILGAEIAVLDYQEFYLHATDIQLQFHIAPWFSNADLFFSGLVALVASTAMLRSSRPGRSVTELSRLRKLGAKGKTDVQENG